MISRLLSANIQVRQSLPFSKIDPASKNSQADTQQYNDALVCRACQHVVTARDMQIAVNGSAQHVFVNPAGIAFHIGCFTAAPGCMPLGEPTQAYTWFAGFAWTLAACVQCHNHIGWFYQNSHNQFCGLILDRLAEIIH